MSKEEKTPEQKARELINMYYNHNETQLGAINSVDKVLMATICEKIDSLHGHMFFRMDFDLPLIESSIKHLKFWQEVAAEVQKIRDAIPV
jgi:hypothetical protein